MDSKLDNWLIHLQQGKGKEISRAFFREFSTQENISLELGYKRQKRAKGKRKEKVHYVEPIVNIRCKEWEKLGFLEKSKPIPFKDRWDRNQYVYWKIMSLEPIFRYCKEYYKIEFSEKEKIFLDFLSKMTLREKILNEFKNEDIITAFLLFYTKHFIMKYFELLKDIEANPKKYNKERKRAEEIINPKTPEGISRLKIWEKTQREIHKKYSSNKPYKKIKQSITETIIYLVNTGDIIFNHYVGELKENKELIFSIDKKILTALNLNP